MEKNQMNTCSRKAEKCPSKTVNRAKITKNERKVHEHELKIRRE